MKINLKLKDPVNPNLPSVYLFPIIKNIEPLYNREVQGVGWTEENLNNPISLRHVKVNVFNPLVTKVSPIGNVNINAPMFTRSFNNASRFNLVILFFIIQFII